MVGNGRQIKQSELSNTYNKLQNSIFNPIEKNLYYLIKRIEYYITSLSINQQQSMMKKANLLLVLICAVCIIRLNAQTPNYGSQFGNNILLNGSTDYIRTTNSQNYTAAFTLEAWIKIPSLPGTGGGPVTAYRIFSKGAYFGDISQFPVLMDVGANASILVYLSKGNDFTPDLVLTSPPLSFNVWHHIALTYQSNTSAALYIDGVLISSSPINFTINTNATTWAFGRASVESGGGIGGTYFKGKMDEVRIWNVARTESQILATMNSQLTGNETGLVGYWDMNRNGQGTNLTVTNKATATGAAFNGTTLGITSLTPVFTVNEFCNNPVPTITASGLLTFCAGESVTLTSSSSTGTHLWSNGANSQSITVNNSGAFTVTNTDVNGCVSPTSAAIDVTVNSIPAPPTINANSVSPLCGNATITLTSSAATGNNWTLQNSNTTLANTQNYVVSAANTGVNTTSNFVVTTTDNNGCTSATSAPFTVTILPIPETPTITPDGPTTFCQGDGVVLTSNVSTGNLWSNGSQLSSITVNTSGDFSLQQIVNGCSSAPSEAVSINVNPLPAPPVISAVSTSICNGQPIVLNSNITGSILWSNNETTQNIAVTEAEVYNAVAIDINGCISNVSNSITVTSSNGSTAGIISGVNTTCRGNDILLSTNGTPGGVWSSSNPAIATVNATGLVHGVNYGVATISYTVSGTCVTQATTSTLINVAGKTPVISGPVNICQFFSSGNIFSAPVIYTAVSTGASGFTWTVPPGVEILSGQGTGTLTVRFVNSFITLANKKIRVVANSVCGNSPAGTLELKAQLPSTPATIQVVSEDYCALINNTENARFVIPKSPGASSYTWEAVSPIIGILPVIHEFPNGENDTIVKVNLPVTLVGTQVEIRVGAVNECGISQNISRKIITVGPPSSNANLTGPNNICSNVLPNGSPAQFQWVENLNTAAPVTYQWSIIVSGVEDNGTAYTDRVIYNSSTSTNILLYTFPRIGITSGRISVTRIIGGCALTRNLTRGFNVLYPSAPARIDITPISACPRVFVYSIGSMPANATSVEWTVPSTGNIISGQGTTSIRVQYNSSFIIDGIVTARSMSNCRNSSLRALKVKLPFSLCRPGDANKNTYNENVISVEMNEQSDLKLFPNPSSSVFNLNSSFTGLEKINIRVLDLQGRTILQFIKAPKQPIVFGNELNPGTYMLEVTQGKQIKTTRLIKL